MNHLIQTVFAADPAAHVWHDDERIWIYASHDQPDTNTHYMMLSACSSLPKGSKPVYILPLGDSITQGGKTDPDKESSDTFDWTHPNPNGQKKMAEKWYEAMQPYLGVTRKDLDSPLERGGSACPAHAGELTGCVICRR